MRVSFDIKSIADYRRFVRVRQLPVYRIEGRVAVVPDEYAARVDGGETVEADVTGYDPSLFLFFVAISVAKCVVCLLGGDL